MSQTHRNELEGGGQGGIPGFKCGCVCGMTMMNDKYPTHSHANLAGFAGWICCGDLMAFHNGLECQTSSCLSEFYHALWQLIASGNVLFLSKRKNTIVLYIWGKLSSVLIEISEDEPKVFVDFSRVGGCLDKFRLHEAMDQGSWSPSWLFNSDGMTYEMLILRLGVKNVLKVWA